MLVGLSLVYWFFAIFVSTPSKQQTKHVKTLSVCKNVRILIIGATGSAANVLRAPGSRVKCKLVPRFSLLPVSRGCSKIRDLTIRQRRRPWKRRWKIDFASFHFFSRLFQGAHLLKRREFGLEPKRRDHSQVLTEIVEFIAFPFRSWVNLKFGHFTS